jgi:hypothetical protein
VRVRWTMAKLTAGIPSSLFMWEYLDHLLSQKAKELLLYMPLTMSIVCGHFRTHEPPDAAARP